MVIVQPFLYNVHLLSVKNVTSYYKNKCFFVFFPHIKTRNQSVSDSSPDETKHVFGLVICCLLARCRCREEAFKS